MTTTSSPLEILYQDDTFVAVNKPCGMLVHPGKDPEPRDQITMKVLRDQLGGTYVYPLHRLDRPTSGVLLFALDQKSEAEVKGQFARQQTHKEYLALFGGKTPDHWVCDQALARSENEPLLPCSTEFSKLAETPSMFPDLPLSLIKAQPLTGRIHQIRKHAVQAGYNLLGDYLYGDHELNAAFAAWSGYTRLMLHSSVLEITHPVSGRRLRLEAPTPEGFESPR